MLSPRSTGSSFAATLPMPRPEVLDNLAAETTHSQGLAYLVEDIPPAHGLSVATGYVNLGGLHHLAAIVEEGRSVRVLLGAMPEPGLGAELPALSFEAQMAFLQGERDFSRFPPSRAAERLQAVEHWLSRPNVEVKRYLTRFLHGKAYLFGDHENPRAALVTSANLTSAGLASKLELGRLDYNPTPSGEAIRWFDGLWAEAASFGEELRELLFPAVTLVDPETVYLRALLELYGGEAEVEPAGEIGSVRLAAFQRDGYERARRILERHGGVVYADGVGTGKTEIGLAFIEEVALKGGRYALVICPAQLRRIWEERINAARLPAQVVSFNELATDEQLAPESPARRRHLHNDKDAYRLIVIDEAHALRNEDTSWYRAMERLLGGERKQVVMLTATPINNGLWDLYNLVMLFAHHDRAFSSIGVPSVRELFVRAGANERDPESLDPDVLFPIADAVSVRRDRLFIQERYPGETFADGTPVRFPEPRPRTARYDLDDAHPGLFEAITGHIGALEMARYLPSAHLDPPQDDRAEGQLGGLLQSQLLKRFESCWRACLATVERMILAHDAFLAAWDGGRGHVPSRAALREAARVEAGDVGIVAWVEEALAEDPETRPASDFRADYGDAVARDREHLVAIRELLAGLSPETDPKLRLLVELLADVPPQKVAVFATYGETIKYLDEHLPELVSGRERVVVVGSESSPDDRSAKLGRFSPETVVRAGYVPPDGEVDLLLSTDVLSEGQNLQQAQAVISYDMPWNPQRVVQRNGRVIRLLSPHEEVFVTTMLPQPGELEELLRLETRVRAKIRAAGVYGMEVEVIEGIEAELHSYAERLAAGDLDLLEEEGEAHLSGAFLGEELRARVRRAVEEGELTRLRRLPWGIGAVFRQATDGASGGPPGVFFATRTKHGDRYWRYVELDGDLTDSDLEMLRRIDPGGSSAGEFEGVDLEGAWQQAAEDIVAEHNRRADPRAAQEAIGPAQRFALELLRDPAVILPEGAEQAAEALSVTRGTAVRRALNEIRAETLEERISRNEAVARVVQLVTELGLQPVALDDFPEEITEDDLGVVCWMAVLPSA
jgi:superfamily II DNA or RNA helicase